MLRADRRPASGRRGAGCWARSPGPSGWCARSAGARPGRPGGPRRWRPSPARRSIGRDDDGPGAGDERRRDLGLGAAQVDAGDLDARRHPGAAPGHQQDDRGGEQHRHAQGRPRGGAPPAVGARRPRCAGARERPGGPGRVGGPRSGGGHRAYLGRGATSLGRRTPSGRRNMTVFAQPGEGARPRSARTAQTKPRGASPRARNWCSSSPATKTASPGPAGCTSVAQEHLGLAVQDQHGVLVRVALERRGPAGAGSRSSAARRRARRPRGRSARAARPRSRSRAGRSRPSSSPPRGGARCPSGNVSEPPAGPAGGAGGRGPYAMLRRLGERSSVGRAPGCGPGGRGFESPRSPLGR